MNNYVLKYIAGFWVMVGLLVLLTPHAWGYVSLTDGLHGSIGLTYSDYELKASGEKLTASSFSQQYSILWQKSGLIKGGRVGNYTLGLGYEWNSLDTEIGNADIDDTRDKFLYQGRVLLAPGGLPFRLLAYSEDMSSSVMGVSNLGERSDLYPRHFYTSIFNGQHIRTGVTLVAGIRNGSYLGRYRDLLSRWPRLFVDYQEDYVKDTEAISPIHYRLRDLAFVSLNKKDNWFHYRMTDYTDYENSLEDFETKTYLLGTIDNRLSRQWIHLTNWIKISTDMSYTTVDSNSSKAAIPRETFVVNFFSAAQRNGAYLNNFSNYVRKKDTTVTKSLELPFYGGYRFNRDTDVQYTLRYYGNQETESDGNVIRDGDNLFARASVNTYKSARWSGTPTLSVEHNDELYSKANAVKFRYELYTNSRYRYKFDALLGSTTGYWLGENDLREDLASENSEYFKDTDFFEQTLYGQVGYRPDHRTRIAIRQDFRFGSGDKGLLPNEYIHIASGEALEEELSGTEFLSYTLFALDHRTTARLSQNAAFENRYVDGDAGTRHEVHLRYGLDYQSGSFRAYSRNEYRHYLQDTIAGSLRDGANEFTSRNNISYKPNRSWEHNGTIDYRNIDKDKGNKYETLDVYQNSHYSLFTSRGFVRRVFDFEEELRYESRNRGFGNVWNASLAGYGTYYWRRDITLGASLRYYTNDESNDRIYYGLSASMHRRKFTASIRYTYGIRDATDSAPQIDERLVEVEVKRTF